MTDPSLWSSVPFRNPTALLDFFGDHGLWHRAYSEAMFRFNGATYRTYPLSDGGASLWLQANQAEHQAMRTAVGLGAAPDLASFDLGDRESFASFMFVHANEHRILRAAIGFP